MNLAVLHSPLAFALLASVCTLVAGAPLGAHLLERRMVWFGFVLPQIAALGVAIVFAVSGGIHVEDPKALLYAALGAIGAVLLFVILFPPRASSRPPDTTLAVGSLLSAAATTILMSTTPSGGHGMVQILRGDLLTLTQLQLATLTFISVAVVAALTVYSRELLQLSIDPRFFQVVAPKRYMLFEGLYLLLLTMFVSAALVATGPLLTFAALVLVPLVARGVTGKFSAFFPVSVALAVVCGSLGFTAAYYLDLPPSACQTLTLAAAVMVVGGCRGRVH